LLILLAFSYNLAALCEVRTCTFGSALPSTGVRFLYSSAFIGSGVQNIPGLEQTKIVKDVYGGSFSLMLDPRWEASAWVTSHEHSTSIELQAKFLWLQKDNRYLSLAFSAYNSEGQTRVSRYEYVDITDKCRVNGFAVPLIFTVDTQRNLLMNVSAGLNCDWVTASGEYKQYNHTTHQYDWVTYGYDPLATLRWHLNFSLEAYGGGLTMIPEIGITYADAGDQGIQRFFNYGIALGGRF
jgi:hypothetical protein